ncbi:hypothetical protein AGMMS50276_21420 [Synergistales bacterium]|nr:hypothetical protein AGMMS50276_21420 [Synergistales bacterium]
MEERIKKKKRTFTKPVFLFCSVMLVTFLLLGFLRFQIFRLGTTLSSINRSIERYSDEETELRQNVSSLTSLPSIYNYCKEKLGMGIAQTVEKIQIQGSYALDIPSAPEKGWRSRVLSMLGFSLR